MYRIAWVTRRARKFPTLHSEMAPRVYEGWMKGTEGKMSRIIMEMMPIMPGVSPDMHEKMMMQMKLALVMQEGEQLGSRHDTMMKLMPKMADIAAMPMNREPKVPPMNTTAARQ